MIWTPLCPFKVRLKGAWKRKVVRARGRWFHQGGLTVQFFGLKKNQGYHNLLHRSMVFGLITKGKICNKRWHPHLENETSFHLLEQSVFPVRHSRASTKVGSAWKRVARVMNPTQAAHLARVTFPCGSRFSRSLACSFCATIGLSGDCSRF